MQKSTFEAFYSHLVFVFQPYLLIFVSGLTQLRIVSDDRTLFAISTIDHFEKLQKQNNESHVILKGMATRVKDRLNDFATMPATEVNICSIQQVIGVRLI